MPRSLFILDEIRSEGSDGTAFTIDAFCNHYGLEEGYKRWKDAEIRPDKATEGQIRELVVVLKAVAQTLEENDPTILSLVQKLVSTLCQHPAAAASITPLCPCIRDQIGSVLAQLKDDVRHAEDPVSRRSAAIGLAAVVKGLGMKSVQAENIMGYLHDLITDGSNGNGRQGAIFVYECLFRLLGYPFEPYVIKLVPDLILGFNDQLQSVREAAQWASQLIFANLSPLAVRRLLPGLLKATEDRSWRTKSGITVCLGAMAGCAPRALSACLPTVVPRLADLISDSNPDVTKLAGQALTDITKVITNPEIVMVVPQLLDALTDPNGKTRTAIQCLMGTSYVHPIDPPSLAVLMPILHWGLRDRSADTKRAAVQVVGSACSLVKEDADLLPYLAELMPELKELVLDSIPDTRLFAAKAIGMLLRRFGEEEAPELVEWLLKKMEDGNNQIERHGAALCLAEVLYVLGIGRFKALLPVLRSKLASSDSSIREGFMGFLLHLPIKFPEELAPFIPELNDIALKGLVDASQPVRTCAMQVGIQLMQVYHDKAEELLLPSLEDALTKTRFKEAGIILLGYLLARMAGTFDLQLEPDEMQAADVAVNKVSAKEAVKITEFLGKERRDSLLSTLFMFRFDPDSTVGNMSGRVMRSLCENMGAVMEDIFPVLIKLVFEALEDPERSQMGARCVGHLAARFFDAVLPTLMPWCMEMDVNVTRRMGAVMAVNNVVNNGHKDKIAGFHENFKTVLIASFCYPEARVQKAGEELFNTMLTIFGEKVIEQTVKALLTEVEAESEAAVTSIEALCCVKKSEIYKFLANWINKHPVQGLFADRVNAICHEAGKMQAAVVKPKKKLGKKSALDKQLEKATRTGKSAQKK